MVHSSGAAVIGVDVPLGALADRWRTADPPIPPLSSQPRGLVRFMSADADATGKDDQPEAAAAVRDGGRRYAVAACTHAIIAAVLLMTGWHIPEDRAWFWVSAAVIALIGVFWVFVFLAHRHAPHLLQDRPGQD
jgi:MFS family permease